MAWRLDGLATPPICEHYDTQAEAEQAARDQGLKTFVVWEYEELETT